MPQSHTHFISAKSRITQNPIQTQDFFVKSVAQKLSKLLIIEITLFVAYHLVEPLGNLSFLRRQLQQFDNC